MFQDKIRLKRVKEVGVFKKRLSRSKLASEFRITATDKKQELNACIHTCFDPLVTLSPEGVITDVNEASEKITGVTPEELIGTYFSNYFTEPEKARAGYKKVFEEGSVSDYPLTIRHKQGRLADVLYNASVYEDDKGNVLGAFAAVRDVTEQKQDFQYSRNLIEASLDSLVTISPEGKITDVNEASEKVTGIPREKLIDTDFSNYFTDPKKAEEGYLQVFDQGFVTDYPLTIKNKNGNLTDVLYNASVYKDDKGNVLGVFASARDVTEQKQASQYARSLIEASLDPLVTISVEGKITDVNEASVKVTGIPREKLIDTDFSNYFTDPQKAEEGYLQVFDQGFVTDYPLTIKNKNGNLTDVLYNASVYKDDKGNVLGVFASARDVTEQKQASQYARSLIEALRVSEEDLRNINVELEVSSAKDLIGSEHRFRSLFDNAPQCMLVVDLKSEKIINANKSAVALFKYSTDDLLKMGPRELSPEWQSDGIASDTQIKGDIEKLLKGKKVSNEWVYNDAHGDEIQAEVSINLLYDTDMSQVIVNIIDVTEKNNTKEILKLQLDELKKTNSELDRFVYSASHDLRSPLKSMLGLSNMIIDDISLDNRNQLEQMGMMQSSIIKLDNFIEDILDYSRNARKEVEKKAIDFEQTIDEIMKNLAHMDGADSIELKLEINQKMEFISDRARVNMILINIISNAIKYKDTSKENAIIVVSVKCSIDYATIIIDDNGIGIDEKNLGRIFDMFYRATKFSTGSGLGLYITKEAIEKVNGSIKIESKLTSGTQVSIRIPNALQLRN
jgi:PAS domain S-box-containing protein